MNEETTIGEETQPMEPGDLPEEPVEEGEKYDGGDIPRNEPTEQEG